MARCPLWATVAARSANGGQSAPVPLLRHTTMASALRTYFGCSQFHTLL